MFGPQKDKLRDPKPEPESTRQPLLDELRTATSSLNLSPRGHSLTPSHMERIDLRHGHHSADFDLVVSRASLFVDIIAYISISLSQNGPQFFAASMISSFGAGFSPATQSLALYLMPSGGKDAGKLFGALGMLGALSTQVIGPSLFGFIYMGTVAVSPKAIFIVGVFILLGGLIALSLVRLPRRTF